MSDDARSPRICRMLDDPDLGGDLLLVGIAFARFLDFGGIPAGEKLNTKHVIKACWPSRGKQAAWKLMFVLRDDTRTYKAPEPGDACSAPLIRKTGTCAATSLNRWALTTDWATGERHYLGACTRHVGWFEEVIRLNLEQKPKNPPLPAANHGGVLARHIPEFDWPKIWNWANRGGWVEHPEVKPWPKPTLSLVLGDGDVTADRALLAEAHR